VSSQVAALVDRSQTCWRILATNAAFQVAAIVCVHSILFESLFRHGVLPESAYFEPVLAVAAARHGGLVILTLLPFLVAFVERRDLRWQDIDPNRRTRWLIWGIAGIFAWAYSTYAVNLYFDQPHAVDRILLVGLWIALWFHPIAIVPFLSMVMLIVTQQHAPLPEGPWTWPDKRLPLDLLLSFESFLIVRVWLRDRIKPFVLPFTLLCVTGTLYGHAAVNKALLGPHLAWWVTHNDLANLFVSSHVQGGWLREAGDRTIISIGQLLHAVKLPLAAMTFLVELSGFALVIRWNATRILLAGFILFHTGIVLSSGIFFWKWMITDALLLWYFVMLHRDARNGAGEAARQRVGFFTPRMTQLALAVMATAPLYFNLVPFAWFDTRLVNFFEIYGVANSGKRYRLDGRFFAPYDIHVQQSRHYPLLDGSVLVGTYGVTFDPRIAVALETAKPSDLPELRRRYGQRWTSPEIGAVYVDFIRRYVVNAQRRGGRRSILSGLAPPYHFRTTPPRDTYDFLEPLTSVEIEFREFLYDGSTIIPTRHILVSKFTLK
jgi:hypothetical protein